MIMINDLFRNSAFKFKYGIEMGKSKRKKEQGREKDQEFILIELEVFSRVYVCECIFS